MSGSIAVPGRRRNANAALDATSRYMPLAPSGL
jgi:hypothetical protein